MPDSVTVLIAAPELLPALKDRAARDGAELLSFAAADALRALETIMRRRPAVVALERAFAATPRGAALINRIKADPSLTHSEIRVVSHEPDAARTAASPSGDGGPVVPEAPQVQAGALDEAGTRRAPRIAMAKGMEALIDGNPAALVDLSSSGAQVVSPTTLKPNQRVRVTLSDERGTIRLSGSVTWAAFEIPHRYRAGIDFLDADAAAVDAYALRHQAE